MSRTGRFARGVGVGYMTQAVVILVGFWLTPFLLGRLGQNEYGLWLVTLQLLGYLGLLDVGIVAMLPRESAYARARDAAALAAGEAAGGLAALIRQATGVSLWQLAAMCSVAAGVMLLFPAQWQPLRGPLSLVFLVFAITFPLRVMHGVLLGVQDLAYVGMVSFAQWGVAMAITIGMVILGYGIWSMAVGWCVGQVVAAALWWWRVPRLVPGVLPSSIPMIGWTEVKGMLSRGVWFSLSQIANVLLVSTDLLVIGKLLGPAAVVPYAVTGKLITVLAHQPQMFTLSAVPALSDMRQRDERDRMLHTLAALTQLLLIGSGAVACLLLAVNGGFVRWWVGVEQYGGDLLTAAMLVTMLLRHLGLSTALALHAYGTYDRRGSLTAIADGAVSVIAGVVLVRLVGPIGATLGSMIGVLLVSLPLNLHVMAREHDVQVSSVLARVLPVSWRIGAVAIVVMVAQRALQPSGPLALALAGALAIALYGLVMLPLLRRPPLDAYVLPRFARLRAALRLRPAS